MLNMVIVIVIAVLSFTIAVFAVNYGIKKMKNRSSSRGARRPKRDSGWLISAVGEFLEGVIEGLIK
jgi:hypothetical protein